MPWKPATAWRPLNEQLPRATPSHSIVPTSMGAGLTSACLGLIQALDTIGLKAGFLKPFMQNG